MTKSLMANEEKRWSYMTHEAMKRRLFKITNVEKLKCFIHCAGKYRNRELKKLAVEKLNFMS